MVLDGPICAGGGYRGAWGDKGREQNGQKIGNLWWSHSWMVPFGKFGRKQWTFLPIEYEKLYPTFVRSF